MRLYNKSKKDFMAVVKYEFKDLMSEQQHLLSYDSSFQIMPYRKKFTRKVREKLFRIVFNQKLFAYLNFRMEKMNEIGSLGSNSSLSVFGLTMNDTKNNNVIEWNEKDTSRSNSKSKSKQNENKELKASPSIVSLVLEES